jgi:hypothetical protein
VLKQQIEAAKMGLASQGWDGSPTRFVIFGVQDDLGFRRQVEIAVD